jgi:hypothetical protein
VAPNLSPRLKAVEIDAKVRLRESDRRQLFEAWMNMGLFNSMAMARCTEKVARCRTVMFFSLKS